MLARWVDHIQGGSISISIWSSNVGFRLCVMVLGSASVRSYRWRPSTIISARFRLAIRCPFLQEVESLTTILSATLPVGGVAVGSL